MDKHTVEWRRGMHRDEGGFAMTIEARWRVRWDHVVPLYFGVSSAASEVADATIKTRPSVATKYGVRMLIDFSDVLT
jgi:hypothetical protein